MTTLLLGGHGKTALQIAAILRASNQSFLVASRTASAGSTYTHAKFDWFDERTYESPFLKASSEGMKPIASVWLVAPPIFELAPPMIKFVEFARAREVKRFVLLSASTIEKGGPAMGQVHAHLDTIKGIVYAVLRPTWFMDNFSTAGELQQLAIKNDSKIYSAAGDGKIPFISAKDIAKVAVKCLTNGNLQAKEYVLLGPKLHTYDEVASIISGVVGREIVHVKLSEADFTKHLISRGVPLSDAEFMAIMETGIKNGGQESLNDVVEEVTGSPPETFTDFAFRHKECWM
ncbi:NAD(P)-binding Rossmann-fold containing protein [Glarea lozoyensis ATCC 20868]|uniref:NAD(P)-binding Rossmann-fold containing protein n=1 Tax=Glarea lozoyensis (strain ATCC 20868 / MF5171) TaxID=1116229 RepID=S3D563_GLAL2|nr:NAD(P)-binding Rossmann-fold containing protein [Glarea lozoyensis ATCC 20868]EPE32915.1 NAD(P)-binding Rossmann-fold containing protein [Glarea lozoyensis ATCC 20868]